MLERVVSKHFCKLFSSFCVLYYYSCETYLIFVNKFIQSIHYYYRKKQFFWKHVFMFCDETETPKIQRVTSKLFPTGSLISKYSKNHGDSPRTIDTHICPWNRILKIYDKFLVFNVFQFVLTHLINNQYDIQVKLDKNI